MASKYDIYQPGDVLNKETGSTLVENLGKGRGVICCGGCQRKYEAKISNVLNGSLCRRCAKTGSRNPQWKDYKPGDVLNKDTGSIFICRTKIINNRDRLGYVLCGGCNRVYETRIDRVVQGCLCKKCREEKIRNAKTIYKPGDIIVAKNGLQFLFVKELPSRRFAEKISRYGIFSYLLDGDKPQKEFECQLGHVLTGKYTGIGASSAEATFEKALNELKILYYSQFSFEDLVDKNILRFDFAIPLKEDKILLIELDGEQHVKPVAFFGGEESFDTIRFHDELKNKYVDSHDNLLLIRISHTEFSNITVNFVADLLKDYGFFNQKARGQGGE